MSRWAAVACVGSLAAAGCCGFSGPYHSGPVSDHFDGVHFVNQPPMPEHGGPWRFLRWQLDREQGEWPADEDAKPGPAPPPQVAKGQLRVTYIGHASLLVQLDEHNILTDPIWSERATPVSGIGPKRVRPPGIRFRDLPRIDAVVVSHNHYDHLDLPTLERLNAEHPGARFFVGLGNRSLLTAKGIDGVEELDWWQSVELSRDLKVVMVPAQHFSGRGLCDMGMTLWGGWVFASPAGAVYFAGDTGFGPHFAQIRRRFGAPRLALLPIGAYLPRWFMAPVHLDPADAVRAHRVLGAKTSVAMHWGTFPLADEARDQAPQDLARALAQQGVDSERFWVLGFGEGRKVP